MDHGGGRSNLSSWYYVERPRGNHALHGRQFQPVSESLFELAHVDTLESSARRLCSRGEPHAGTSSTAAHSDGGRGNYGISECIPEHGGQSGPEPALDSSARGFSKRSGIMRFMGLRRYCGQFEGAELACMELLTSRAQTMKLTYTKAGCCKAVQC